jgi:RHS repeat-associated protein
MAACPSFRRARPARRFAGRKLASGFFGRCRRTGARKILRKSPNSRRVARPAATKTASGVRYYGLRYYCPSTGRWLSRDPSEEDGGTNLYGFVSNDPIDGSDSLGLVGGVVGNRPFTAQEVEGARTRAFQLITYFGDVGPGLPQKLLHRWLWKEGDYQLTDDEFNEHLWGDKPYRVNRAFDNPATYNRIVSLQMSENFKRDLESNCKSGSGGETFSGTYSITDYANTGRTLGHFFWSIEVQVKCGCCKGGYEAKGSVHVDDEYNFDVQNRANRQDESDVAKMRRFHTITGMGRDFNITTSRYPVSETSKCDGNPMDTPYLKRD